MYLLTVKTFSGWPLALQLVSWTCFSIIHASSCLAFYSTQTQTNAHKHSHNGVTTKLYQQFHHHNHRNLHNANAYLHYLQHIHLSPLINHYQLEAIIFFASKSPHWYSPKVCAEEIKYNCIILYCGIFFFYLTDVLCSWLKVLQFAFPSFDRLVQI